jgi:hypothetical protein
VCARSFADVAQPDQARIVGLNAHHFLKNNGHIVVSIKANCIDSTAPAEVVFAAEVKKMQLEMIKPHEQLTLEPCVSPPSRARFSDQLPDHTSSTGTSVTTPWLWEPTPGTHENGVPTR